MKEMADSKSWRSVFQRQFLGRFQSFPPPLQGRGLKSLLITAGLSKSARFSPPGRAGSPSRGGSGRSGWP
ncbi:hypothetical protein C7E20_00760 [Sphingobium sp. AEW4]|nr:hypothetical protein C7E20_00760 [Sphingobium sp. AEW4]